MGSLTKQIRHVYGENCIGGSVVGITKEYGKFLIGEINKKIKGHYQNIGVMIETDIFNNDSYFIIK